MQKGGDVNESRLVILAARSAVEPAKILVPLALDTGFRVHLMRASLSDLSLFFLTVLLQKSCCRQRVDTEKLQLILELAGAMAGSSQWPSHSLRS